MLAVAVCEPRPRCDQAGAASSAWYGRQRNRGAPRPSTQHPRPFTSPLSEATLSRLWAGQRFPASALVTRQGAPLRVLRPGRPGRGAGPDFRDALIAAPSGRLLRGDVELHVRARDFRRHGHHRDARYNGVVLHVVFEDDDADETLLASGRRVPVVALARWTRRRADELAAWLAAPQLWREPCHDAVARLGREGVEAALEQLGDLRFRERAASVADLIARHGAPAALEQLGDLRFGERAVSFAEPIDRHGAPAALEQLGDLRFGERAASFAEPIAGHGAPAALYRALLEGAGYGGERALSVAERLSWQKLSARLASVEGSDVWAEALLLGAAGLLPSQQRTPAAGAHESALERCWQASGLASGGGAPAAGAHESALERCWQASGLASIGHAPAAPAVSRPSNHPARRLAGVARLLTRHRDLLEGRASLAQHVAQSTSELIAAWTVAASGYWRCCIAPGAAARAPGAAAKRSPGALIGRSRAIELLTNAVLPWAAAVAEARGESPSAAMSCFQRLPRPGRYGALAFLEANLKQNGVPLPLNARRQQGLLALYKTECTQGGCGRCPLS